MASWSFSKSSTCTWARPVSAAPSAMWSSALRRAPSPARKGFPGTFSDIRDWPARSPRGRPPAMPGPPDGGRQIPMWRARRPRGPDTSVPCCRAPNAQRPHRPPSPPRSPPRLPDAPRCGSRLPGPRAARAERPHRTSPSPFSGWPPRRIRRRARGGQRRRRGLLPQAFDAGEAGLLQHVRMPRETAGDVEQIVIEKQGAGLQHPGDLAVAGGDRLEIAQIVNRDRRYGEIERSADARAPMRVAEIGEDVTDPLGVRRKPAARFGEHRLRIVLQRHPCGRKGAQYLLRDDPVAAADIEDRDRGLGREGGMREHLPDPLPAFPLAPLIARDPPRHITLRVPVVFADRKALLRRRHVALPPGVGGQD